MLWKENKIVFSTWQFRQKDQFYKMECTNGSVPLVCWGLSERLGETKSGWFPTKRGYLKVPQPLLLKAPECSLNYWLGIFPSRKLSCTVLELGEEMGGHDMDQSGSELFHSPACTRAVLPALTATNITMTYVHSTRGSQSLFCGCGQVG